MWRLNRLCVRCFIRERSIGSYLCAPCKCEKCKILQHMNDSRYCHECVCGMLPDCYNCKVDEKRTCSACTCELCSNCRENKSKYCEKCKRIICGCKKNATCNKCKKDSPVYWYHFNFPNNYDENHYVDKNIERVNETFVASLLKVNVPWIDVCIDDVIFDLISYNAD